MKPLEFNELQDRLGAGRITRRELMRAAAVAGVAMTAIPLRGKGARAAGEMDYFTWSGYEEPNFHKAYADKYGGEPKATFFATIEEALQKMLAGYRPDVSHPCTDNIIRWRDAGVLRPLDTSRLIHWGDLWPELTTIEGTVHEGKHYIAPFDWGNTSVIYRADLVDIKEESWALLFDERYAGKLSVQNSSDHAVIGAAMALGIKTPFAMNDDELAQVRAKLIAQKPLLRFYWDDVTSLDQALASGEIVASTGWNESLVRLKQQGLDIKYMNPKEGILTWVCGLSVMEGAPGDEQAAYDFINAMQDPESGKFLIENWGYGHSNKKSFETVKPERLAELGFSSPADLFAQGIFFVEVEPKLKERYNALFEEVKAGL